MTSTPEPDERLLEAHDLARASLLEITSEWSIGAPAGYTVEEGGVVSLRFETRLGGYPGWFWTVSVARVEGSDPTVLEVELLPGEGALLAPDWVPWAERLADYQAAQAALAAETGAAGDDEGDGFEEDLDDDLDDDDLDAADFSVDGSPILHAGDVDGVDIDELADLVDDAYGADADESDADESDEADADESDEDDADEDESDEADEADEADEREEIDDADETVADEPEDGAAPA